MNSKVKRVHTHNAPEFMSIKKKLEKMEIRPTITSAYSTQSNVLAERMKQALLDKARTFLMESGLNRSYWAEAVIHAADLYNRTGIEGQGMKTPYDVLLERQPNNTRLRVFGCAGYAHRNNAVRSSTFDNHVGLGIYLGAGDGLFRIFLLRSKRVVKKMHATFDEKKFPLSSRARLDISSDLSTTQMAPPYGDANVPPKVRQSH